MKKPTKVLEIFEKYNPQIEKEIKEIISDQEKLPMYDMMSYFFGFLDEDLKETFGYGGKRFRPGLCLLLSDFFGSQEKVLEAAVAIEIFHNFTLIHDDIADKDDFRRGRPTVWNKWGLNHALNTGDAQLLLVNSAFFRHIRKNPEIGLRVQEYANRKFIEVAEGQFLDFQLSELPLDDPFVTEENILTMMTKKSGVLVGLSSAVSGMIAEKSESEVENLWDYGLNLGITYQFCDDIASVWGKKETSGKEELADIREKKKTLPIVFLFESSDAKQKDRLRELYLKKEDLSQKEISEVKEGLDRLKIRDRVIDEAKKRLKEVRGSIDKMPFTQEQKEILEKINGALFPLLGDKTE